MTRVALTREVSESISQCELSHVARQPIDIARARTQHAAYEEALREAGCRVERVPPAPGLPDAVFVEDAAVVLADIALLTRPGAASRRAETTSVQEALRPYRRIASIEPPGTLDGGDVLVVGRRVFVGRTARTNAEGILQLRALLAPFGYSVVAVDVRGCLHLKSAVTAVADGLLLVQPEWVDRRAFPNLDALDVDPDEPFAANALLVGSQVIYPATFPRTAARLAAVGIRLLRVEADELAKAEGAVTCCSLVFEIG
jgi:dimethylargininase